MAGNPLSDPNWASSLADTVDRYVAIVRDKTTDKVVMVVRALVFATVIGVAALAAGVLAIIGFTKLLQNILHVGDLLERDTAVWVSYLLVAGLFAILGAVCMKKRHSKAPAA